MVGQYPGYSATTDQLLVLAREYKRAAQLLFEGRRRGRPLSLCPFRLTAIHALELYLNALLLAEGLAPAQVRGLQHNMKARAELAQKSGLVLRRRTAAHLSGLAETREYLVSRYGPELANTASHVTRLMATLEEVSRKATERIEQRKAKNKDAAKAA